MELAREQYLDKLINKEGQRTGENHYRNSSLREVLFVI